MGGPSLWDVADCIQHVRDSSHMHAGLGGTGAWGASISSWSVAGFRAEDTRSAATGVMIRGNCSFSRYSWKLLHQFAHGLWCRRSGNQWQRSWMPNLLWRSWIT